MCVKFGLSFKFGGWEGGGAMVVGLHGWNSRDRGEERGVGCGGVGGGRVQKKQEAP